jgi:ATP synthase protein I
MRLSKMRAFERIGIVNTVSQIIFAQFVITIIISIVLLLVNGSIQAVSAMAGGAVGFLTSLVYARKMFPPKGSDIKKIIRAQYSAEAYKLAFTILLFSLIFTQFKEVHALPLFATYGATLAVYWAALIFV